MARMKFLVPDLLTGLNICIGLVSIILVVQVRHITGTIHGNYILAAWLIVIAGIIDGLDGAVARKIGEIRTFGIEFDSLADLTVFGVVPSVLLYACFYQGRSLVFVLIPILYLVASTYRLARFNTDAQEKLGKQFAGLPTTVSGTIMVGVVLLFADFLRLGVITEVSWVAVYVTTAIAVVNSLLMVSTIEFDALATFWFRKSSRVVLPFLALITLLLLLRYQTPVAGLLALGLYYILIALLQRKK